MASGTLPGTKTLNLIAKEGIKWTISDEGVLSNSINFDFIRDFKGNLNDPYHLLKVYNYETNGIDIIFRDRSIPNLINFEYAGINPKMAAGDLFEKIKMIQTNISCIKDEKVRHNPEIIAASIIEMLCNDLKFHDMQNDTEYLLLQSVLKEQKKVIAQNEKRLVKVSNKPSLIKKKNNTNKRSKFKEKYNERVNSIQNTESKIAENKKIAKEIEKMEKAKKRKH